MVKGDTLAERKLSITKAKLVELAEKNLKAAREEYDRERAAYPGEVASAARDGIAKLERVIAATEGRATPEKIAKAVSQISRYWDPPSRPDNHQVCRWKQRLDWLRAAKEEKLQLTQHEYSEYVQEKC
jgi:hypothetical protein